MSNTPNKQEAYNMAQIEVVDIYQIHIQAKDAMKFTDRQTGKEVIIEAQKEREAMTVICKYDEYILPFILPEHFDANAQGVKIGSILNVTASGLETIRPINIRNVNRVINPAKRTQ